MSRNRPRLTAALAASILLLTGSIALGASSASAVEVTGDSVVSVEAGYDHTCVIDGGPVVKCWGKNASGVEVPDTTAYGTLAAGYGFTCGIQYNGGAGYGDIDCWGEIIGSSDTLPAHIDGDFLQISAGGYHVCATERTSWIVSCWGDDWADRATPPSGTSAFRIAGGQYHTCAIVPGGAIDCWGNDSGDSPNKLTTQEPPGDYSDITAGSSMSCALRDLDGADPLDRTAVCWGFNPDGRTNAPAGVQFLDIDTANAYTCGIRVSDRKLQCWGAATYFADPLLSPPTDAFQSLSGGLTQMCGITTSAVLKCWGDPGNSEFIPGWRLNNNSLSAGAVYTGGISGTPVWPAPTWSVSGTLPSGITFDSSTGVFSGTTTGTGYFPVTISTTSTTIPITIETALYVNAGATAELDVLVDDATVTQGDTVTVDVYQYDQYDNLVTNYSPDAVLSSSDPADTWSGSQVTFAFDPASPVTTSSVHTITATMGALSATETVNVDAIVDSIELDLAPTTATVGDTITVGVTAKDSAGGELADVSDYVTVTSDVPEDIVSGNTVEFTHASPHTITVSYGTLSSSFVVEVSPAAVDDPTGLASTGMDALPWLALAIALLLIGGVLMLIVLLRRKKSAQQ